jgi:PAS domain S-box-containing protein
LRHIVVSYGVSLAAVAAAVLLRWLLDPLLGDAFPLVTLYGAVAAGVWFGGCLPAIVGAAIGYLVCDYLFIEPRGSWGPDQSQVAIGLVAYLFTCIIIIIFGETMRVGQRRISEQRERLRTTLASVGDAVITTDRDARITHLNAVAEKITRWTKSAAVGQPLDAVLRIVDDQSRSPVESSCARALREGAVVRSADHRLLIPGNEEMWIDISAAPIRCAQNEIVGCVLTIRDVTERRLAQRQQQALRHSEEHLELLSDTVPALISYVGRDHRYRSCNQAYTSWFGLPREEIVGRPMQEVLGEQAWRIVRPNIDRALNGEIVEYEAEAAYQFGGSRWIHAVYTPHRTESGVVGVVVLVTDITQRKQGERAQARLAAIVDSSDDAIVSKNLDGVIQSWNLGAERLFGYSADEAIGRSITMLIPESRLDEEREILNRIRRGEPMRHYETVRRHKDGTMLDISLSVSPIVDESGRVIAASKIARDVTARKRAEEQIARNQKMLTDLVERCPFGIYIVDSQFRITIVNVGSQEGAFRNVRPLIGRPFDEAIRILWPDPVATEIIALFRRTLDTGEPYYSKDYVQPRADVEAVEAYEWELHRIALPEGGFGVVCYYFDSTQLRRTELELRQAEESLRDADRRKDEFLATLAHELRNPLAPIRNALAILHAVPDNRETRQHATEIMGRQLGQMVRLVDDLLDVSRISRGKLQLRLENVELASVVHQAVEICRPIADHARHNLTVTLPEKTIVLHADPVRLAQILSNLLNNACKFTNPGGQIQLTAERNGNELVVSVRDNGIGIPKDKLDSIFEMFSQADQSLERAHGGLGIGLTLVKRLVELHGGSIEARSEGVGRGSEFVVRLPIVIEAPELPSKSPPPETLRSPVRRRILVVDDNHDSAESLAAVLNLTGHEASTAHDGPAAVAAADTLRPEVILLDIGLPKMSGYEVCRRIRVHQWGKEMMIFALTGWGQDEDRRKTKEAGFDGHLVKPVDHETLMKALGGDPCAIGN